MVNTKEIPPEAILLAVYLELQNGESHIETVNYTGTAGKCRSIFQRVASHLSSPAIICHFRPIYILSNHLKL